MPSRTLFTALATLLRDARRRRRDQQALAAMSEQQLRDLGIGRSEVPAQWLGAPRRGGAGASRA